MSGPETGVKLTACEVGLELIASDIAVTVFGERQSGSTNEISSAIKDGAGNRQLKSMLDDHIQANLLLNEASRSQTHWEHTARRLQILQLIETRINDVPADS